MELLTETDRSILRIFYPVAKRTVRVGAPLVGALICLCILLETRSLRDRGKTSPQEHLTRSARVWALPEVETDSC